MSVRLLTIYGSVYQNESETKSSYTCWGIRNRYTNGSSVKANIPCYGYRRSSNGELEIQEIPSPQAKHNWSVETVRRILHNEKYKGHVLLQKTYVSNYFIGKRSTNNGELPKYLIEDHHEAISE